MYTLVLLLIIVLGYTFRHELRGKKTVISLVIGHIPFFIQVLEEQRRILEKKGESPAKIDKVEFVINESRKLAKLFDTILDEKTEQFIKLVTIGFTTDAQFKKSTTISFYNLLLRTKLDETQVYHLTYIFNRFIGEALKDPTKAMLDGFARFFKFLREFGYFKWASYIKKKLGLDSSSDLETQ